MYYKLEIVDAGLVSEDREGIEVSVWSSEMTLIQRASLDLAH